MTQWTWLTKPIKGYSWWFAVRVLLKAGVLFGLFNLLFAVLQPMDSLGRLSLYNTVLNGRDRLPYGENSAQSYNITVNNLPAMFASHTVTQPKADDEFRVLIIGDSSIWGWLLENDETLSASINQGNLMTDDGRRVVAYNLGYPIMSLTKDLLLLDYAMRYQPDMIVWSMTLRSMLPAQQLFPPIVQNNADAVRNLIRNYDLNLDADDSRFVENDFMDNTIIGQRRNLADLLRLQVYGFSWHATQIDQYWEGFPPTTVDFDDDISFLDYDTSTNFTDDALAFEVLSAGVELVGDVPLLLVNEPIFISDGENNDLHYNIWYPRWAYDRYHDLLTEQVERNDWQLLDLWDTLPADEFTDSPVHTTANGSHLIAEALIPELMAVANSAD